MLHTQYVPTLDAEFVDYLSLGFWTAPPVQPRDVLASGRGAKLLMITKRPCPRHRRAGDARRSTSWVTAGGLPGCMPGIKPECVPPSHRRCIRCTEAANVRAGGLSASLSRDCVQPKLDTDRACPPSNPTVAARPAKGRWPLAARFTWMALAALAQQGVPARQA